jgi:tRNA (guanine26-N2/guanine27-N2)-dimethyltransferase
MEEEPLAPRIDESFWLSSMSEFEDRLKRHIEGKTTLVVPEVSLRSDPPPTHPVFFNPRAKPCRDLSIICYNAFAQFAPNGITFCDVMTGIGARGVRVGVEVSNVRRIVLNDWNEIALDVARRNILANGLCSIAETSRCEANLFAYKKVACKGERFTAVDVDPFGSPAQFLESSIAICEDGGIISVGATDSAVLSGVYPLACFRKYYGYSIRCDFSKEVGIRLLLGALVFAAIRRDFSVEPLFSHVDGQYTRVYCRISKVAGRWDCILRNLGFVLYCSFCGYRSSSSKYEWNCPCCGRNLRVAGPLWVGRLFDKEFLQSMLRVISQGYLTEYRQKVSLCVSEESFPPCFYSLPNLADMENIPTPSTREVQSELLSLGFRATRTSFSPTGIRTDAPTPLLRSVVKKLGEKNI